MYYNKNRKSMKKNFIDITSFLILGFKGIITGIFGFLTNIILEKYIKNEKNKN